MASNITTTNIDVTYPIPGVDNDTQGFRDNFSAIKNALDTAKDEIEAVQITQANLLKFASTEPSSLVGVPSDTIGTIYANSTSVYFSYSDYVSTATQIWNKIDTTMITESAKYVSQPPTSRFGKVGDTAGMIFASTNTLYICFQDYVNTTTAVWGKVAIDSTSW